MIDYLLLGVGLKCLSSLTVDRAQGLL